MNTTYVHMRQGPATGGTVAVNADQVHSFLKDKQAWENAIGMHQGPDPLDHWYNYICWYENHGHGDPENKYRETLERCLTIFEHNDYYKQDARMVRLWLKYINMQPNPLHFYQVLYQRGTGRQVAAFYIGWANYYETAQHFQEAESVYKLGFQEKAQSYAELQNAHSKLIYARTVTMQQQQRTQLQLQQQHEVVQQQQDKQSTTTHQEPLQQQQQVHYPQQLAAQQQTYAQQAPPPPPPLPAQQQQQHSQQVSQNYRQQQQQYQQHLDQQQQHHQQQLQANHQQHPQHQHYHQQTSHQQLREQEQQQMPQMYNAHPHPQLQFQQQTQQNFPNPMSSNNQATVSFYQQSSAPATATTSNTNGNQQQQQKHQLQNGTTEAHSSNKHQEPVEVFPGIEGVRLPRNFATFARNNNETWKPALTLEEPEDPYRQCHYPKQLVYPIGAGLEYSPEELCACKFENVLKQKHQEPHITQQQQRTQQVSENLSNVWVKSERLDATGTTMYASYEEQQQQQLQQTLYVTAEGDLEANNNKSHNSSYNDANEDDEAVNDNDNDNDDGDDDKVEEEVEPSGDVAVLSSTHQQNHQHHHHPTLTTTYCDDQIEASTIRFSMQTAEQGIQNKTIKIKFKKERPNGNDSLNGSEYSAYTIENIYQPDIPTSPQTEYGRQRNGHSFHPYMMGQTSTPKTSGASHHYHKEINGSFSEIKRSKSKLKRIHSKFQAVVCSNSNSSSADQKEQGLMDAAVTATAATAMAPNLHVLNNATFNDNANHSFSSASALDNSNCSIASAVGRLNFRDTSVAGNTTTTTTINNNNTTNNNATTVADFSMFQENSYFATQHDTEAKERRLAKALEAIERHMAKEAIDPFNSELCRSFLTKLDFPGADDAHANYKIIQTSLPKIANTKTLCLPDGVQFNIDKEVGRGSYGSVYKATDVRTGNIVALKFQKPPNSWEIYICDQVLKRIQKPSVLPGLMDISTAIIAPNASLIATEFSPFGSLLDINNKIRQATTKVMHESLVMHFSAQICNIIRHLHAHKIIHADIKPDNFLLMRIPSTDLGIPSLRLIDFGCAIDMTLFPDQDKTKFRKVIQTDGFTCIEMQEGRPWSYETDLFCIAGTVHVMLFGEYMQLQKRGNSWDIRQKLPRYLKKHVWSKFFGDVLNIKAGNLPDLLEMRNIFEEEAYRMDSELQKQIRTLSNILMRR